MEILFAEVVSCSAICCHGEKEELNLIALGRRHMALATPGCELTRGISGCFGAVWIMIVDGGEEAMASALSFLGCRGSIRSDFHEAYNVSKKAIGSGSCSTVYLARQKSQKSLSSVPLEEIEASDVSVVAAKVLSEADGKENVSVLATSEVSLLLAVQRHPNIVGFYGIFNYPEPDGLRWVMTLQWCASGDLHDSLVAGGPYREDGAAKIIMGILSALAHVHKRGLVHRDVKAENILMSDGTPVLSDFGITARINDMRAMDKRCGSPGYAAPEILGGSIYGSKVDVFSAGVVLYFCMSGVMPFAGPDVGSVLRRTLRCKVKFESQHFDVISKQMKRLVLMLVTKEPTDRVTSEAGFKHFQSVYARRTDGNNLNSPTNTLRSLESRLQTLAEKKEVQAHKTLTAESRQRSKGFAEASTASSSFVLPESESFDRMWSFDEFGDMRTIESIDRRTDRNDSVASSSSKAPASLFDHPLCPSTPTSTPSNRPAPWRRKLRDTSSDALQPTKHNDEEARHSQERTLSQEVSSSSNDNRFKVRSPAGTPTNRTGRFRFGTTKRGTPTGRSGSPAQQQEESSPIRHGRFFKSMNLAARCAFARSVNKEEREKFCSQDSIKDTESEADSEAGRGWDSWNSEASRLSSSIGGRTSYSRTTDPFDGRTSYSRTTDPFEEPILEGRATERFWESEMLEQMQNGAAEDILLGEFQGMRAREVPASMLEKPSIKEVMEPPSPSSPKPRMKLMKLRSAAQARPGTAEKRGQSEGDEDNGRTGRKTWDA
jgi:serine/threonine protein kinase